MIYEPQEDSLLLSKQVRKFSKGKNVLDVGSGSGIQTLAAIKSKAKSVLATDINEESCEFLKKQSIPTVKSNLFQKIKGKFDLIIFNPPYLPEDSQEDKISKIITTGGKKGDEIILSFLKQAYKHLNKKGIIILVISSLTPQEKINFLLTKLKLRKKILSRQKLFMESLEVWKIKL